jgi:hypothetical protein
MSNKKGTGFPWGEYGVWLVIATLLCAGLAYTWQENPELMNTFPKGRW